MIDEDHIPGRPVVDFDHHSQRFAATVDETYDDLRARCPVAWTEAHGGYWVVTSYEDVATAAGDDVVFSSANDVGKGPRRGITIPSNRMSGGLIETDPPRFTKERRALNPWFSPAAVDRLKPEILEYTTWCIDRIVERGACDFAVDLASPVPAMLTVRLLGLPLTDWERYADAMHRGVYTPPGHPDRREVEALTHWVVEQLYAAAIARRDEPADDLISFLAALEIDGERMPIDEVAGNAFTLLAGGVDTTTALILNALLHLDRDRAARAWLMADESRLRLACEEYLRYVSPVQGLARTITAPCHLDGQELTPFERVWLSWAAANRDPSVFDAPGEIRLDRYPNRHAAFGLGAHRCLGSNVARAVWNTVVTEVLRRLPDYEIDHDGAVRYTSIGIVNGWASVPARFVPGEPKGTTLHL